MKIKALNTFLSAVVIGTALTLTGCGGGSSSSSGGSASISYSGSTSAAVINGSNASTISTASGVAVQKAGNSQSNAAFAASISSTGSSQLSTDNIKQIVSNTLINYSPIAMPTGVSQSGSCGGSVSASSAPPSSGPWTGTATFSNYCTTSSYGNVALNGSVAFNFADVSTMTDYTLQFSNFTVQANGQTITLNSVSVVCSSTSGCDYTTDFVAPDGSVYETSNTNITGDASTGYNGTMTFYDPTDGYVTVSANSVTYGNCGDYPDGGTITINDSTGGMASITFSYSASASPACTYSGSYTTAGGTTGNFNGTTP